MNSHLSNFSTVRSLKVHEEKMTFRAKEIFKTICNYLNPGKNFVKSNYFSEYLVLFNEGTLNGLTLDMINEFMAYMVNIKETEDFDVTEKDFCDFVTGQNLKKLLFEATTEERISRSEKITKLYYLLKGNENGISAEHLKHYLNEFMEYLIDPDGFLENGEKIEREYCRKETEKLIKIIATSDNSLTLEDFINAVTGKTNTKFDNFALETS